MVVLSILTLPPLYQHFAIFSDFNLELNFLVWYKHLFRSSVLICFQSTHAKNIVHRLMTRISITELFFFKCCFYKHMHIHDSTNCRYLYLDIAQGHVFLGLILTSLH